MQVDDNFFTKNHISRNQRVEIPMLESSGIELYIKREDEIHPSVSGNKFRKLKYNLLQAKKEGKLLPPKLLLQHIFIFSRGVWCVEIVPRTFVRLSEPKSGNRSGMDDSRVLSPES